MTAAVNPAAGGHRAPAYPLIPGPAVQPATPDRAPRQSRARSAPGGGPGVRLLGR